jgi:Fe-S-cluster-containing dehydrogenase component
MGICLSSNAARNAMPANQLQKLAAVEPGVRCAVVNLWQGTYECQLSVVTIACQHCASRPASLLPDRCYPQAERRRSSVVDRIFASLQTLAAACPFCRSQYGSMKNAKFDFCLDHLVHRHPCVRTCPTQALTYSCVKEK